MSEKSKVNTLQKQTQAPQVQVSPQVTPEQSKVQESNPRPQVSSVLTNDQVQAASARLNAATTDAVKKGRGRPKGSVSGHSSVKSPQAQFTQAPVAPLVPLATLESIMPIPFQAIADLRGCDAWKLKEEENKALCENVQIILKYMAPQASELSVAITGALLIVSTHAYAAIMAERELKMQAEIQLLDKTVKS